MEVRNNFVPDEEPISVLRTARILHTTRAAATQANCEHLSCLEIRLRIEVRTPV